MAALSISRPVSSPRGDFEQLLVIAAFGALLVVALWYLTSIAALIYAKRTRDRRLRAAVARWGAPLIKTLAATGLATALATPAMASTDPVDLSWGSDAPESTSEVTDSPAESTSPSGSDSPPVVTSSPPVDTGTINDAEGVDSELTSSASTVTIAPDADDLWLPAHAFVSSPVQPTVEAENHTPVPDSSANETAAAIDDPTLPSPVSVSQTGDQVRNQSIVETGGQLLGNVHVVQPGETLWSIVRDHYAPATDAQVANLVLDLWSANSSTIGSNPDLIYPGQRLELP